MSLWDRLKRALGRPPPRPAELDAIEAFWDWWSRVDAELAEDAGTAGMDDWVARLSLEVARIDERLGWEMGPGRRSKHHLCLTSEGDAELRIVCERWLAAAPEPDAHWEFHAARQGGGWDGTLEFEGVALPLAACRFGARPDSFGTRLLTEVHHPGFAQFSEAARSAATFVMLDNALGEDEVERWLRVLGPSSHEPEDAIGWEQLTERIDELRDGSADAWVSGEGTLGDRPLVFVCDGSVKRVDHLFFDVATEVRLPYGELREDGLPDAGMLDLLHDARDALLQALGPEAVELGAMSHDGARTLFLRTPQHGRARAILDGWAKAEGRWSVQVEHRIDPRWQHLPPFWS